MTRSFVLEAPFSPSGDQPAAIQAMVAGLAGGHSRQTLLGVTGSGKTFSIAHVIQQVQRPTLILAPNKTLAAQLYAEMKQFFPHNAVEYFVSYYDYYQPEAYVPSSDTYIEKESSINETIDQLRHSATKSLLERSDTIVVASVSAIYGLGDPNAYLSMKCDLSVGEEHDLSALLKRLVQMQFQRNDMNLVRGTFRLRGDTLDVFPADAEDRVIRAQFFDETLESLAWIDPLTGKKLEPLQAISIFPKTHHATPRERVEHAIETIREELKERLKHLYATDQLVEAQRLEQRVRLDLEMLQELGYCHGVENYSRHLSQRDPGMPPPTLMEYLPADALLVIDESHVTVPQIGGMSKGDAVRKETLVRYGFRLPSARDNRPLNFEEFQDLMPDTIFVSATPGSYEQACSTQVVEQIVRPTGLVDPEVLIRPVATQVDDLLSEIITTVAQGDRVLVTTLTKKMAERLTDYYQDHGIKVRYLHSDIDTLERVQLLKDLRAQVFDVLVGINLLREGLDLPEVALVAILDADKEGFLRSTRSLIQTVGRAARHVGGRAIMYADRTTQAMSVALSEMERRRVIQLAHNQKHGIIPRGINKALLGIMDVVGKPPDEQEALLHRLDAADPDTQQLTLAQLQAEMLACADRLDFEQALRLRELIKARRKEAQ